MRTSLASSLPIFLVTLLLSLSSTTSAALPTDDEIGQIVRPFIDDRWCMGVVIGVIDANGRRVVGFGRLSEQNAKVPDGDTVFEIASITKVFTGLLLSQMAQSGELALDDPVQKYLPDNVKMPGDGETPITLLHIATHRSGLPRLPNNMRPKTWANPYADYTEQNLYDFLSSHKLRRKPGEQYEYSNLAYGLLGNVLGRRAGKSYETLLAERIFSPLQMNSTRVAFDDSMRAHLAPGHDADGRPANNWDFCAVPGGGAIRSTANDMLKFLAAQIGLTKTDFDPAIRDSHVRRQQAGGAISIALAWHIMPPGNALWHNGQTGGYHSTATFLADKKIGVVVLANTATMHADQISANVMRLMMGQKAEPIKLSKFARIDGKILDQYAGRYALSGGKVLVIEREGDHLVTQADGQTRVNIYPASETAFFARAADSSATFVRDDNGRVARLEIVQPGAKAIATRMAEQ